MLVEGLSISILFFDYCQIAESIGSDDQKSMGMT